MRSGGRRLLGLDLEIGKKLPRNGRTLGLDLVVIRLSTALFRPGKPFYL